MLYKFKSNRDITGEPESMCPPEEHVTRTYLGLVADLLPPYPFRKKITPSHGDDAVRVVQYKNVKEGKVDWRGCTKHRLPGKKKPVWLLEGDIIFLFATNSTGRFFAVTIDNKLPYQGAVLSKPFFCIRIKPEWAGSLHPDFLTWLMNQKPLQDYFDKVKHCRETQPNMPQPNKHLRRASIEDTPVVIPSMEHQVEILKQEALRLKEIRKAELRKERDKAHMESLACNLFKPERA